MLGGGRAEEVLVDVIEHRVAVIAAEVHERGIGRPEADRRGNPRDIGVIGERAVHESIVEHDDVSGADGNGQQSGLDHRLMSEPGSDEGGAPQRVVDTVAPPQHPELTVVPNHILQRDPHHVGTCA